jgi:hypothetical protein
VLYPNLLKGQGKIPHRKTPEIITRDIEGSAAMICDAEVAA